MQVLLLVFRSQTFRKWCEGTQAPHSLYSSILRVKREFYKSESFLVKLFEDVVLKLLHMSFIFG